MWIVQCSSLALTDDDDAVAAAAFKQTTPYPTTLSLSLQALTGILSLNHEAYNCLID